MSDWYVIEDKHGDRVIDCEPNKTAGRIIYTGSRYTDCQRVLAEHSAELWPDFTPSPHPISPTV